MLERLLDGEESPRRETVLLNVAVALVVEGRAGDVAEGYERARSSIDTGSAREKFDRMRRSSGSRAGGPGAGPR